MDLDAPKVPGWPPPAGIRGNESGTDGAGTVALDNDIDVIDVIGGSFATIGGTAPGAGDVISANSGDDIVAQAVGLGRGDSGTPVSADCTATGGNFIGADRAGTMPLPDAKPGVDILADANWAN